jgi:hypothetical protein
MRANLPLGLLAGLLLLTASGAAVAQDHGLHGHAHTPNAGQAPATASEQPPSYTVSRKAIAFFNTPNRHGTAIAPRATTEVGKVRLDLDAEADVLVTFTSGVAAETGAGCPCSIRALLQVGDQAPVIVKRINVGAPSVQTVERYEHDRQPADGSYVFTLPKGRHDIALVMQPVDGAGTDLEAYYVNLQAVPHATGR